MKLRKLAFLSTIFAILLPTLVVATVVITYTYPVTYGTASQPIYLALGPNYKDANTLGLVSISGSGWTSSTTSVDTYVPSGDTITLNAATGSSNTYLLNVLEIVNDSSVASPTYVWINTSSMPSGVHIYYNEGTPITMTSGVGSSSGVTFNSGTYLYTLGTALQITKGITTIYLAFVLPGTLSSSSGNIYITYQIE